MLFRSPIISCIWKVSFPSLKQEYNTRCSPYAYLRAFPFVSTQQMIQPQTRQERNTEDKQTYLGVGFLHVFPSTTTEVSCKWKTYHSKNDSNDKLDLTSSLYVNRGIGWHDVITTDDPFIVFSLNFIWSKRI